MTRTATLGLAMVGGFTLLLVVASVAFIKMDEGGVRGAAIGAGLGLLNLGVGYLVTRRALKRGMKSAMATLAGGFFARLVVIVGLMIVLHKTGAADPVAFALAFFVLFFVYLGVEVVLVERSLNGTRRAA